MRPAFLTEGEVIDAVACFLEAHGWSIRCRLMSHQTGIDIVAARGEALLAVEAKGGGSSKPHTRRFGTPFSRGQKLSCISEAFYAAARQLCLGKLSAIALPDDLEFRDLFWASTAGISWVGAGVLLRE